LREKERGEKRKSSGGKQRKETRKGIKNRERTRYVRPPLWHEKRCQSSSLSMQIAHEEKPVSGGEGLILGCLQTQVLEILFQVLLGKND